MAEDYNPIFERIFSRVNDPGDEIVAYIAYGIYKERKRDFLVARRDALAGPVPAEEIATFHRTYDEGQIDLVWRSARETLASFAVTYADAEKKDAVNDALASALHGKFWKDVGVAAAANLIFAVGIIVLYFILRFVGFDLVEKFRALDQIFPGT